VYTLFVVWLFVRRVTVLDTPTFKSKIHDTTDSQWREKLPEDLLLSDP